MSQKLLRWALQNAHKLEAGRKGMTEQQATALEKAIVAQFNRAMYEIQQGR